MDFLKIVVNVSVELEHCQAVYVLKVNSSFGIF